MNATEGEIHTDAGVKVDSVKDASSGNRQSDIPFIAIASDAAAYAQAWLALASGEASLAKRSLVRLVCFALLIPAIALAIFLCFDALLAATLVVAHLNLALALLIVWLLNLGALGGLIWFMRKWWLHLTFPRSRAALSRFMESVK